MAAGRLVKLTGSDWRLLPPIPEELERAMPGSGALIVGSKGRSCTARTADGVRLIPEAA